MKTEMNDARDSDKLEERLTRRFAVELRQAERDYPALPGRNAQAGVRPSGRPTRLWQRLAIPVTAIAAVLAVALIGAGLVHRPATSGPTAANPAASGVVMGADGIPTQIDGQRVYRVSDEQQWRGLDGSFLLGGHAASWPIPCPFVPQPSAESLLISSECGGIALLPNPDATPGTTTFYVAGLGVEGLSPWIDFAVVVRVHAHDQEAAQCSADKRAACEAALVVEAVVWPYVPADIAGEHVYRASEQGAFPASGAFLLGGVVNRPTVIPPCPAPIDKSEAELQLIPYCTWTSIDGLSVAPKSSLSDVSRGQVIVARVHVNDPLAQGCPASARAECEAGIVVEAVVWRSGSTTTATATPTNAATPGPLGSFGPLDADGIPTTIGGQTVYRASYLPTVAPNFLLGGTLTREVTCGSRIGVPPSPPAGYPPACGAWMIDGVMVGASPPGSMEDMLVVGRITRSRVLVPCISSPCAPQEFYVLTEIVWSAAPAPGATPRETPGSAPGSEGGATPPAPPDPSAL